MREVSDDEKNIHSRFFFNEFESSCVDSKTTPRLYEIFLLREVICIERSVTFHCYVRCIGGFFTIPASTVSQLVRWAITSYHCDCKGIIDTISGI